MKIIPACVRSEKMIWRKCECPSGPAFADTLPDRQIHCFSDRHTPAVFPELEDTCVADCRAAMGFNNNDLEDAMLIACAVRESMSCIVTRNAEHFKGSSVPVVTPADFVRHLNKTNDNT